MTVDDPFEAERAELLAQTARGEPLTDAQRWRVAEMVAAAAEQPLEPVAAALRVLLDEASAQTDRDPEPGLTVDDLEADPLVVRTRAGEIYTTIPRLTLVDLAERIRRGRGD